MRKTLLLCGAFVAGLFVVVAAEAKGPPCARPGEVFAVDTAIIQQELMVAALTCHEVERFNAFQTGYGPELRDTDARLARMFARLYGRRRREGSYHAFKTKAANEAEMRSIHNNPAYCSEAGALFSAALVPMRPSLATFVSASQAVITARPISVCLSVGPEKPVRIKRQLRRRR